jgi:hypothetical protein
MSSETPVKAHEAARKAENGESAKDIEIRTIAPSIAKEMIINGHYSHKVAASSVLHFGVFWKGKLEGVLQYGHPIDKRKSLTLVADTDWNGFLELNRMYMSPVLPKNTESRALAITLKLIRKNLPQIKWVVSYADGTQAGSGTIYRASGFLLIGIKKNTTIYYHPGMKETFTQLTFSTMKSNAVYERIKAATGIDIREHMGGAASIKRAAQILGMRALPGYQLRYIYFLDPAWRDKLRVPTIPFEKLKELEWPEGIK